MRLGIILLNQDDPSKCTALKLVKFNLAKRIYTTDKQSVVLNPFSKTLLLPDDRLTFSAICAVDCSWENIRYALRTQIAFRSRNNHRRLPSLLAGNPTNYSRVGKLTTAEALAGSAYILGNKTLSFNLMNKFKWGHTFLELNAGPLEEYSCARDQEKMIQVEREYFE